MNGKTDVSSTAVYTADSGDLHLIVALSRSFGLAKSRCFAAICHRPYVRIIYFVHSEL